MCSGKCKAFVYAFFDHAARSKKKILYFGFVPWWSSFGVDGELREFIRELRMCAIALRRKRVYLGGSM